MLSALRDQLAPGGLAAYGATLLQLAESELSSWPDSGEVSMGWTVLLRFASARLNQLLTDRGRSGSLAGAAER